MTALQQFAHRVAAEARYVFEPKSRTEADNAEDDLARRVVEIAREFGFPESDEIQA